MQRIYRLIMDPQRNPLSVLPPPQRFQLMVILSVMWSVVFSAALGLWAYYGAIVAAHVLVLLAIAATGLIFRSARRVGAEPAPVTGEKRDA